MKDSSLRGQLGNKTLLPHQVEFIEKILGKKRAARMVFVSPVGSGKSVAISVAIGELAKRKKQDFHCLVVVPAALQPAWQGVMHRFGNLKPLIVDAPVFRLLEAQTPVEKNPWMSGTCLITSHDFLKTGSRLKTALSGEWDVVVIDEIHLCSQGSQRGEAVKSFWNSIKVKLAIASTATKKEPDWIYAKKGTDVLEWDFSSLIKSNRQRILPERKISINKVHLTQEEIKFFVRLNEILVRTDQDSISVRFLKVGLKLRSESSLFSIENALRRYAVSSAEDTTLDAEHPDEALISSSESEMRENMGSYFPADILREIFEIFEKDEKGSENVMRKNIGSYFSADIYSELLELFEQIEKDSKWEVCAGIVKKLKKTNSASLAIVTDYADTAEYLGDLLRSRDWPARVVTGRIEIEERWRIIDEILRTKEILILTPAITEGADLSFVDQVIHYDLPLSPFGLLLRFKRFERMGRKAHSVSHYFLADEVSTTTSALNDVLSRVEDED